MKELETKKTGLEAENKILQQVFDSTIKRKSEPPKEEPDVKFPRLDIKTEAWIKNFKVYVRLINNYYFIRTRIQIEIELWAFFDNQ